MDVLCTFFFSCVGRKNIGAYNATFSYVIMMMIIIIIKKNKMYENPCCKICICHFIYMKLLSSLRLEVGTNDMTSHFFLFYLFYLELPYFSFCWVLKFQHMLCTLNMDTDLHIFKWFYWIWMKLFHEGCFIFVLMSIGLRWISYAEKWFIYFRSFF